jgi:hypothetical protein
VDGCARQRIVIVIVIVTVFLMIRVMRRKRGVIPWFVYVVWVIIVVIVVANRDALRNYRRRDDEKTKDINPQETHQARLPN